MKRALTVICCCMLLGACGGGNESEYDQYYDRSGRDTTTAAAPGAGETATGTTPGERDNTAVEQDGAVAGEALERNYERGEKLIAMSDCLSCHQEEQRLVGPAYVEVAQKYEFNDKNVDYLAGKIIEGGAGVWGQVPMTPHPDLSREDAREMARYILSLRQ